MVRTNFVLLSGNNVHCHSVSNKLTVFLLPEPMKEIFITITWIRQCFVFLMLNRLSSNVSICVSLSLSIYSLYSFSLSVWVYVCMDLWEPWASSMRLVVLLLLLLFLLLLLLLLFVSICSFHNNSLVQWFFNSSYFFHLVVVVVDLATSSFRPIFPCWMVQFRSLYTRIERNWIIWWERSHSLSQFLRSFNVSACSLFLFSSAWHQYKLLIYGWEKKEDTSRRRNQRFWEERVYCRWFI